MHQQCQWRQNSLRGKGEQGACVLCGLTNGFLKADTNSQVTFITMLMPQNHVLFEYYVKKYNVQITKFEKKITVGFLGACSYVVIVRTI